MQRKRLVLGALCTAIVLTLGVRGSEGAEATTVPISNDVIRGTLSLPDGQEIRFKTLEGGLVTVRDHTRGAMLGFSPVVLQEGGKEVQVTVFEITEVQPGQQRIRQIDRLVVPVAAPGGGKSVRGFTVTVEGVTSELPREQQSEDRPSVESKAFTVPISNDFVWGTLRLPDGQEIRFKTLEGGLVTVRDHTTGAMFGIAPIALKDDREEIQVTVFEITEVQPGHQRIRQVERLVVPVASPAGEKSVRGFAVTVEGITAETPPGKAPLSQPVDDALKQAEKGRCCVTCGTTTACGCSVSMDCGSCCSDPCCGGSSEPPEPPRPSPQ
jgi:hypothetical protein